MKRRYWLIILIIVPSILLSLNVTLPGSAYRINAGDVDDDGDIDLIVKNTGDSLSFTVIQNNITAFQVDEIYNRGNFSLFYRTFGNLDDDPRMEYICQIWDFEQKKIYLLLYFNNSIDDYILLDCKSLDFIEYETIMGATVLDINGDGLNDILFVTNKRLGKFINNGNRVFSEVDFEKNLTGFEWWGISAVNLNNDNYDDFIIKGLDSYIVTNHVDSLDYVWFQGFSQYESLICEDFDSDNDNDLAVVFGDGDQYDIKIFVNDNGDFSKNWVQSFSTPYRLSFKTNSIITPRSDILAIKSGSYFRFFNKGNMVFEQSALIQYDDPGGTIIDGCVADFDGNGWSDIAIIKSKNYANILTILYNTGELDFTHKPQLSNSSIDTNEDGFNYSCYSKPANSEVNISFTLQEPDSIIVQIYNHEEVIIRELTNKIFISGDYDLVWDGLDQLGRPVPIGTFIVEFHKGNSIYRKRVVLLE